jgi:hypothetical protein
VVEAVIGAELFIAFSDVAGASLLGWIKEGRFLFLAARRIDESVLVRGGLVSPFVTGDAGVIQNLLGHAGETGF